MVFLTLLHSYVVIVMGVNMRNPNRIKKVLSLIEAIWTTNPDLRLMQLLGNVLPRSDNYYMEDDIFFEYLKQGYDTKIKEKLIVFGNEVPESDTNKNIRPRTCVRKSRKT